MNNSCDDHREQWYTLDTDKELVKNLDLRLQQMEERQKELEQKNIEMEERQKELEQKNREMKERQKELEQKNREMDGQIHYLSNNNLKLINRLLEAEISLERAKNSLVRNHIPFPFSSTLLTRKFGM